MSFNYKNPVSASLITGAFSVTRESTQGTNFSVNTIGGYMEVFYLSDLNWVIPQETLDNGGPVAYSGNSIPIEAVIVD